MHVMNDMLNMWNKLNHTNLFMIEISSFVLKNLDLFWWLKKIWFWFVEIPYLFCKIKKKRFLEKKIQICFVITKKMVFNSKNNQICFYLTMIKKKNLWRGSHSQNNFMLHDSNKTNNKTTIHDLFLYFKNLHMF